MEFLIVGLGNPGNEYAETRHNIGQMAIERVSFRSELHWKEKYNGEYCSLGRDKYKAHFLVPTTFMNLSGRAVVKASTFFKIPPQKILVIHDELDLPFGTIAFKNGGGLAGHNGLKSIAELLGTKDFLRLRIGIGRPSIGSVSSYVLSRFSDNEEVVLSRILEEVEKAMLKYLESGHESALRAYKKKKVIEEEV